MGCLGNDCVEVCETFFSLQGESSYAGLPCFFIRLAGCNLRCSYCDTAAALAPGAPRRIEDLVAEAVGSGAAIVEVTGGEPLLQPGFSGLALALRDAVRRPVLVETNGSLDLSLIPDGVVAIMDVKCPGSGEAGTMCAENLERLRPYDEVKFVLGGRSDYLWARRFVLDSQLPSRCHAVLFSAVREQLRPALLGQWILEDRLCVRLQVQMHALLGLR